MSELETFTPVVNDEEDVLEMSEEFNFDQFQVVRREFFSHIFEPSISFNNGKFYVNTACLNRFPDVEYVQILINQETKILALRPCKESARDSYRWSSVDKRGKRKPRPITGTIFVAKISDLMGWNIEYRYKLIGKLIHSNGEYLLAFDLTSNETYVRTYTEDGKSTISRKPIYPSEWQTQFGMPFNEHKQSLQVNIFDGYAVYAIKEKAETKPQMVAEYTGISDGESTDNEVKQYE